MSDPITGKATELSLSCRLSTRVIPDSPEARLVYLLVEIGGGQGADTLPGNLAFVIDTSDSMRIRLVTNEQFAELARQGQAQEVMTDGVPAYQITSISNEMVARFPRRIDYVAEALVVASEYLRPIDRFSLVAFAGRAQCMIPATSGKERARLRQAARELDYLVLDDGTQMADGLGLALEELQHESSNAQAGRVILLTDGHTQKVNECYEWARRMRQSGLKLSTMGIGVEFNEDLLIPLADMTGGNAYYIERPEQIPDAFRDELGAALRVSYRNVEIKLQLEGGADLRRVYRILPELSDFDSGPNMEGSYALQVGDYDPALPVALLLEVVVPSWPKGEYRLAQVLLAWDHPEDKLLRGARASVRQDVDIRVSRLATAPLDEHVMNIVERVGAYKMGMTALESARSASNSTDAAAKGAATMRLRQAATRLLNMGEQNLANAMYRQASVLEEHGSLDPEEAKKLRYETRRLTQHP